SRVFDNKIKYIILFGVTIIVFGLIISSIIFFYLTSNKETSEKLSLSKINETMSKVSLSIDKKDVKICDKIKYQPYKDNCYLSLSYSILRPEFCDKIMSEDYKKYCLKYKSGDSFSLNLSRTVWFNLNVPVDNITNLIRFEYSFFKNESIYGDGLLTVFFDDKVIYEANSFNIGRSGSQTTNYLYLGKNYEPGNYLMSVRVIPLGEEKSKIQIKNIQTGYTESIENYSQVYGQEEIKNVLYPLNLTENSAISEGYNDNTLTTLGKGPGNLSAVWISSLVITKNPVNFINLNIDFTSQNGSEGLAAFYWDGQVLSTLDERYVFKGYRNYTFFLPVNYSENESSLGFIDIGTYEFSIRLDQYTNVPSQIEIKDVNLGFTNWTGRKVVSHCLEPCSFNYSLKDSY
ncbi:MAG: hypothetical protein KKF65_06225, partial [Nanoarchaeota archaeon]|nr:hypothetical protein [Nanoarchaeota archaeon]